MTLLIASLFTAGITIGGLQQASAGEPPPTQPFETEKFYTETDKDFKQNFVGTPLLFKDGTFVFGTSDSQTVKAVIDKNGKIKSYNPGQYYAVTKVTANEHLDNLWIFEDDLDCTDKTGISKMNPAKLPGGAYVAIMCDGVTEDLSDELAESGALRFHPDGFVEAHVDDVPAGCMVFLGVKYSPGLKGEKAEEVDRPFCENWEFVCLSQDDVPTTTEPLGNFPDECKSASFRDSAHRILEVTGLPDFVPPVACEDCLVETGEFIDDCIKDGGNPEECTELGISFLSECAQTCDPINCEGCQAKAGASLFACLAGGGSEEKCQGIFFEVLLECVQTCEPVTCEECEDSALLIFLFCQTTGGSAEKCFAEVETFLSACALTCEGTPEEKLEICEGAAFFQNLACQQTREGPLVC